MHATVNQSTSAKMGDQTKKAIREVQLVRLVFFGSAVKGQSLGPLARSVAAAFLPNGYWNL